MLGYFCDFCEILKGIHDIFCQRMAENYENAPDEDKEGVPLEECLKMWGLENV